MAGNDKPFDGFSTRKGSKKGGIHASDPEGGIYKSDDGQTTFLFKRDVKKLCNDVAEYMAAELFDELCPGSACKITLHKSTDSGKTFLASEFFKDNYRDLFSDLGKKDRSATVETMQAWLPGNQQYVRKGLSKHDKKGGFKYKNYEKVTAASLLLDDRSVHSGNIGVVNRNDQSELVRIDFGAAFRELSSDIEPMKSMKNRVGFEKNYFLRDHPRKRIFSEEFSAELKREAAIDLKPRIEKAWNEIIKNYDNEIEQYAITAFGKQIGVSESILNLEDKAKKFDMIKDHFAQKMLERQQSQKDMAFEIDLKLSINKDKTIDLPKLRAAIAENPEHAELIVNNSAEMQLKFKLSKKQRKLIGEELAAHKEREQKQITRELTTKMVDDLRQFRGYFDETLTGLQAKIKKQNLNIDISQYDVSVKKWHKICEKSLELVTAGNRALNLEQIKKLNRARSNMAKPVNREFIDSFLKKPEYYKERWPQIISEKGQVLLTVSKEIALEHAIENQREAVINLYPQTRTTRLHNYIKELVPDHPELEAISAKLQKGKNVTKGTYDVKLDTETYLSMYEACKKVELGLSSAEQGADILRGLINKELPVKRRVSSFIAKLMRSNTVSGNVEQEIQQLRQSLVHEKFIGEDLLLETRQTERKPTRHPSLQATETESVDTVVFSSEVSLEPLVNPRLVNTSSVNLSDTVDPITQAIRDEIITTQQLFLKQEIAKGMESNKRDIFQNRNLAFVRAYLETGEGREAVKEVMRNPAAQTQMHEIESKGYKAVHNKFQDRFKNIDWGQREEKIRSTEVTDTDGQTVCTLKESTFDVKPTIVTLEDGTSRSIRSYRQIDFPKKLETGNGPMHVSMALKDQNGCNMLERDAVYFTAHYNDSGKLTEVSSPIPVKFMGIGDDAIGYIERNGKVFTLPVTQGKYKEMMQEVVKNQGMAIDIFQQTETVAQDKIVMQEMEALKKKTILSQESSLMNLMKEKLQERRKYITEEIAPDNPFENLSDNQTELASKILSDIIKEGNPDKVIKALSQLDDSWVGDEMSREDYKNAYNNAMNYAKNQPQAKQERIHRAAAEITIKAGVENHVQRVKQNIEETIAASNKSSSR